MYVGQHNEGYTWIQKRWLWLVPSQSMILNNVVQNDLTAWGREIWVLLGSRNACCDWSLPSHLYLVNLCSFEMRWDR
jgi:hypothetical protein